MFSSKLVNNSKNNNFILYTQTKFFIASSIIALSSLIINAIVRYYNFFSIFSLRNQYPFGIRISILYIGVLVVASTLFIFVFKIAKKYSIASALILVGAWSNLIERLVFGYVVDYVNLRWGYINFADIVLWFGLLLINYQVWFNDPMEEKYSKETHNSVIEKMQKQNIKVLEIIQKEEVEVEISIERLDTPKTLSKEKEKEQILTKPKKQVVKSVKDLE